MRLIRSIAAALALAAAVPAIAADSKISDLASGTTPQSSDAFVIARGAGNFKLTWAQMLEGVGLSSYLTSAAAATTYMPRAGGTFTGPVVYPAGSAATPSITFGDVYGLFSAGTSIRWGGGVSTYWQA